MWTIYSIGDSAFLDAVLNGVAMVTATADFIDMLRLGMLIGVLIMFLQSLWNGAKGVDFGQAFVAFIVLSIAFIPKTDVAIEDVYDGSVRHVANVPLGVVAAGSIISHVGYNITETFETAFSTPAMTEYGFADPLNTLAEIRKLEMAQTELMRSWTNYIKECTLIGVDRGDKILADILDKRPFMAQLKWDSQMYGTEIYVYSSGADAPATWYNCTDAYDVLSTASTDANVLNSMYSNLAPQLGANVDADKAETKVTEALNSLGGTLMGMQQEWMLTNALMPAYQGAVEGKYVDEMAYTHALMANQAIAQRNTQWAAESTMFQSIVRPLMTFLEGFTYAVTPIMAFVISIAPIGGKMAGKYLLTLVWISLWQPVMAVINLYILMSASGKMQALSSLSVPATSYTGMQVANQEIQNWLATGGMLASATPALSLMLVYGSSITATHLAGRLGGGDHIDEKIGSPDVAKTGPAMNTASGFEFTAMSGMHRGEADQLLGSAAFSNGLSSAVSSAKGAASQAQTQWSNSFSQGLSSSFGKSNTKEAMASFGSHVSSSNSQLSSAVDQQMKKWGEDYNISDENKDAAKGITAAILSGAAKVDASTGALMDAAGNQLMSGNEISEIWQTKSGSGKDLVPAGGGGGNVIDMEPVKQPASGGSEGGKKGGLPGIGLEGAAKLQGQASHERGHTTTRSASDTYGELSSIAGSESQQAAYQEELGKSFSDNNKTAFEERLSQNSDVNLAKTAMESASKTQTYNELDQLSKSMSHSNVRSVKNAANSLAGDSNNMAALDKYVGQHHDLKTAMNGPNGSGGTLAMAKEAGLQGDNARAAAALLAMGQSGDTEHLSRMAEFMGNSAPKGDPSANQGIGDGAPASGTVRGDAEEAANAASANTEAAAALNKPNLSDVTGSPQDLLGKENAAIHAHNEEGRGGVSQFEADGTSKYQGQAFKEGADNLIKQGLENPAISNFMGDVEGAQRFMGQVADSALNGGYKTLADAKENVAQQYEETMGRPPEPSVQHWLNAVAGAAYDYASTDMSWSDALDKNYSEHNVASRATALADAAASEAAALPGNAVDNIKGQWESTYSDMYGGFYEEARNMNLTEGQSNLYAASMMDHVATRLNDLTGTQFFTSAGSEDIRQQAIEEIRNEMKYINEDGGISQVYRADELADKQIEMVTQAATGDREYAQASLAELSKFNKETGRVDVEDVPYDAITRG